MNGKSFTEEISDFIVDLVKIKSLKRIERSISHKKRSVENREVIDKLRKEIVYQSSQGIDRARIYLSRSPEGVIVAATLLRELFNDCKIKSEEFSELEYKKAVTEVSEKLDKLILDSREPLSSSLDGDNERFEQVKLFLNLIRQSDDFTEEEVQESSAWVNKVLTEDSEQIPLGCNLLDEILPQELWQKEYDLHKAGIL